MYGTDVFGTVTVEYTGDIHLVAFVIALIFTVVFQGGRIVIKNSMSCTQAKKLFLGGRLVNCRRIKDVNLQRYHPHTWVSPCAFEEFIIFSDKDCGGASSRGFLCFFSDAC